MRRFPLIAIMAMLWGPLSVASPAGAVSVAGELEGRVTSVADFLDGLIPVGETIRVSYVYDDTVPNSSGVAGQGSFVGAIESLIVEFVEQNILLEFGGTASLVPDITTTLNDSGGVPFAIDSLTFSEPDLVSGTIGGKSPLAVSLTLQQAGMPPDMIGSDLLPPFGVVDFGVGGIGLPVPDGMDVVNGTATFVPIPEPSTAALTALGLIGLAARRRRD